MSTTENTMNTATQNIHTADDIRATYEAAGIAQSFRSFEGDKVTLEDIEAALGRDVAEQYAVWQFYKQDDNK